MQACRRRADHFTARGVGRLQQHARADLREQRAEGRGQRADRLLPPGVGRLYDDTRPHTAGGRAQVGIEAGAGFAHGVGVIDDDAALAAHGQRQRQGNEAEQEQKQEHTRVHHGTR